MRNTLQPLQLLLILSLVASAASLAFLIMLTSMQTRTVSPAPAQASRFIPRKLPSAADGRGRLRGLGDPGVCVISGTGCNGSSTINARNVSVQAAAAPATSAKSWWKEYSHLWTDVSTQDEFQHAVNDDNYDLVLVGTYRGPDRLQIVSVSHVRAVAIVNHYVQIGMRHGARAASEPSRS